MRYLFLFASAVLLLSSVSVHAAARCGSLLDDSDRQLIQTLIDGGLLDREETDRTLEHLSVEDVKIPLNGRYWVWDVERGRTQHLNLHGSAGIKSKIVYRASGQPLVILAPHKKPEELFPVPNHEIKIKTETAEFVPAQDWRWQPLPDALGRNRKVLRATISGIPVTVVSRSSRDLERWRFRDLSGEAILVPVNGVLNLDDGRRFLKTASGAFRPVPPLGIGRILAANAPGRIKEDALNSIHHLIDDVAVHPTFPTPHEIQFGPCQFAVTSERARGLLTVIECAIDQEKSRRRVLVIDQNCGEFVRAQTTSSLIQLSDGRYLDQHDGHWFVDVSNLRGLEPGGVSSPGPSRSGSGGEAVVPEAIVVEP